jgi:hypothetical protein
MSFSNDPAQLSNQLPLSIDFPQDPDELQRILSSSYKQTVDSLNSKEGALYLLQEINSFAQFFPSSVDANSSQSLVLRPAYRVTFDLVAMNGGPISTGITVIPLLPEQFIVGIVEPTSLRGAATISGPEYVSLHGASSDCEFDNTNPNAQTIIVTNNYASEYSTAIFIFEYLKTT